MRTKTTLGVGEYIAAIALVAVAGSATLHAETAAERLAESAAVLKEVMDAPDKGIPADRN